MKIIKSEYIKGGTKPSDYPMLGEAEFVFMGRSNVGKSSLINALTNRKNLAYTSQMPGKTRVLNFFKINDLFYLIDVPGYGYQKLHKDAYEEYGNMMENYLKYSKNLKNCFLLFDCRRFTDDDTLMLNYILKLNVKVSLIATKMDKLKQNEKRLVEKKWRDVFSKMNIQVFFVSAMQKVGIEELLDYLESNL